MLYVRISVRGAMGLCCCMASAYSAAARGREQPKAAPKQVRRVAWWAWPRAGFSVCWAMVCCAPQPWLAKYTACWKWPGGIAIHCWPWLLISILGFRSAYCNRSSHAAQGVLRSHHSEECPTSWTACQGLQSFTKVCTKAIIFIHSSDFASSSSGSGLLPKYAGELHLCEHHPQCPVYSSSSQFSESS